MRSLVFVLFTILAAGCATPPPKPQTFFKTTELDLDKAPVQFAPQEIKDQSQSLDPVSMQTQADYHFAMGEAYSYQGDSQKAIESFKMVQIYDPNSAQVPLRLSAEYIKVGLVTQALDQAEIAVIKNPKNVQAHALLGGIFSAMKAYPKAIEQYDLALQIEPSNAEIPLYLGAVYAELKKYDQAILLFKKLTLNEDYPSPHLAYYYLGRVQTEQAQENNLKGLRDSEKSFQKALSIKPDHFESVLAIANVYRLLKQNDKSIATIRNYQVQFGPSARAAEILAQNYLEEDQMDLAYEQLAIMEKDSEDNLSVRMKMALILIQQKKYPLAVEKLDQILLTVPESDKVRFYLAAVLEETGQKQRALENFDKIPIESEFYGESIVHLSYLLKKDKKIAEALAKVKPGLEKRKDVPQLYAVYASLLDENGQTQAALPVLVEGIKKFPDNTQLYFFMGSIQDRLGQKEKVIESMRKVLDLDPNHVQGLNYLSYTLAGLGRSLDEAEQLAKKALSLQPQDGFIMDTLGWVMFKKGKTSEALKVLEKAFSLAPTESIISEHLGDVYFELQMPQKARSMYEKAIQYETNPEKASGLRSKISMLDKQEFLTESSRRSPASNSK